MSSFVYKRNKSCGIGLQSFIDELNTGITEDTMIQPTDIKNRILKRLKTCINDRLIEQDSFVKGKINQNVIDHLNIIKVYYDLYSKLKSYF